MKRSLLATLFIGTITAAITIALQKSGLLLRPERLLAQAIGFPPNEKIGFGNLLLVIVLSFGIAWILLQVTEVWPRAAVGFLVFAELIGGAWILGRAGFSFQPLPAILATTLAALLALALTATRGSRQRGATASLFQGRLAQPGIDCLTQSKAPDPAEPARREVSVLFCEIANQADLIDELPAAVCTRLTSEFISCARECLLKEGGYLQAADGEGIEVLFGFPNASDDHAAQAARAALAFRETFSVTAGSKPDSLGKIDLRIGISSGVIVATAGETERREIVIAGEPLEVARRLALANQTYGSQILLGPRTFSAAGKAIVARPIDFLRNAAAHDRLEIYELLALAEKASPEEIARRDRFWAAIVYFRARRWNEAFTEFNHARGNNGEHDEPLQWYLRRLEPLRLQMAKEPAPGAEPLSPL